jgi:tetratricopeptide (TPR) repeat protein
VIRDADDAAARGDGPTALGLYQAALEMRPGDPLAAVPLVRVAMQHREPAPIAALALAQLHAAEKAEDGPAKADAYELLAHVDRELRADAGSAQVALENASQADPARIDLIHRLEREYADQIGELLRRRRAVLEQIPTELSHDRAAMIMDTATLAARQGQPDAELVELYRQVVAAEPRHRQGLMHLEAIVRRAGASEELARLEELIAAYFEGDARTQASFLTRAGETLAELGQIDAAVQRFGTAEQAAPGHVPALESWRNAALKGQLWLDVAESATRQASAAADADERAALHHFAGVALMDKALIGEQALSALRRALDIDPRHRDAFVRMRILLEEEGNHDELAILIANRLEHEPAGTQKVALHRALAELSRNFLGRREHRARTGGSRRDVGDVAADDAADPERASVATPACPGASGVRRAVARDRRCRSRQRRSRARRSRGARALAAVVLAADPARSRGSLGAPRWLDARRDHLADRRDPDAQLPHAQTEPERRRRHDARRGRQLRRALQLT